jgi:hypothetical protein
MPTARQTFQVLADASADRALKPGHAHPPAHVLTSKTRVQIDLVPARPATRLDEIMLPATHPANLAYLAQGLAWTLR